MDKKFIYSAFSVALVLIVFRFVLSGWEDIPFSIEIIDYSISLFLSISLVLTIHEFIKSRYPDTKEFLNLFSFIALLILNVTYFVLRYYEDYQSSLSVMITGALVGMGWWIQSITTAANMRRTHTLNTIINTRTSSEYQSQLRASTRIYRGRRYVPAELSEWRCNPDKDEYKNINIPKEYIDAVNGLLYVLNYFEFLAQGIKFKDLDDGLLKECFSNFLSGIERRGFHIIIESQKQDPQAFEGIIYLAKRWNGESIVEKYRATPHTAEIGMQHPSREDVEKMIRGVDILANSRDPSSEDGDADRAAA